MRLFTLCSMLGATCSVIDEVHAKLVFAHYMVGNIHQDHVHTDVNDAVRMGLDGFALNIGDPTQPFVKTTLDYMFNYTRDTYQNFKLFISMDVWASSAAHKGVYPTDDYASILNNFLGHGAYLTYGPNNHPFLSTFSDGGLSNDQWVTFKASWSNNLYFVPNFDRTEGYYTADPGWWAYWGDVIDGLFSWESAWPYRAGKGGAFPGDVSPDEIVMGGTAKHSKTYMMPLSALQYKDAYNTNIYRAGDLNLPVRMDSILSMSPSPDFIQVITWNDGPESHYIGNLWKEQNDDTESERYATQVDAPHDAWRPLVTSFISAYKAGLPSTGMTPPGDTPVGALWYKTQLESSKCPNENTTEYTAKPDGFSSGRDVLNWAVLLPRGSLAKEIHAISAGKLIQTVKLVPGLNYGQAGPMQAGFQKLELWDTGGSKLLAAAGGRCVSAECPDCIYNMNPQVVRLAQDGGDTGRCPSTIC